MTEPAAEKAKRDVYSDFDEFLKSAIHEYYERGGGKTNKANFIALLIASGEITSLAVDSFRSGRGAKRLAYSAAGVIALRIGLKYALSGPLGILLAGATAASLITYFIRNRKEITSKIGRYRKLVGELRESYDKLQSDHRDSRLDYEQRNLMIDGLMTRFIQNVDIASNSDDSE